MRTHCKRNYITAVSVEHDTCRNLRSGNSGTEISVSDSDGSRKERSRGGFLSRGGRGSGYSSYTRGRDAFATPCIYQPTSAVSFLRDSRLRYPAGNAHQRGDSYRSVTGRVPGSVCFANDDKLPRSKTPYLC